MFVIRFVFCALVASRVINSTANFLHNVLNVDLLNVLGNRNILPFGNTEESNPGCDSQLGALLCALLVPESRCSAEDRKEGMDCMQKTIQGMKPSSKYTSSDISEFQMQFQLCPCAGQSSLLQVIVHQLIAILQQLAPSMTTTSTAAETSTTKSPTSPTAAEASTTIDSVTEERIRRCEQVGGRYCDFNGRCYSDTLYRYQGFHLAYEECAHIATATGSILARPASDIKIIEGCLKAVTDGIEYIYFIDFSGYNCSLLKINEDSLEENTGEGEEECIPLPSSASNAVFFACELVH